LIPALICNKALDLAEQSIFSVTQARTQQGLTPASDILTKTFYELESRYNAQLTPGAKMPGLSTGFYDLDAMTQGLQRSDLIIIAGRPSMGKTAFSLCVAANMAKEHKLPIAVFSLEMSKEQLVYRLLSNIAKVESSKLRSGHIGDHDWSKGGNGDQSVV
jgi:replicative DNA helicase